MVFFRQTGFPFTECNPETRMQDGMLLHNIKEERCSLEMDKGGLVRHIFVADKQRFSLYLGDETRAAPLAFFHKELLEVTGRLSASVLGPDPGDSQDPHDHLYLRETSRKYTKTGDAQGGPPDPEEFEDAVDPEPQSLGIGAEVLPLHQAILRSVDSCNGDEAKRKMLSTILIVGGGLRFPGAATHLHSRLSSLLGPALPPCEVIIDPKEGESDATCWRGAGVLASLESARELWIRPKEWSRFGQKLLRERAPFPWA